MSSNNHREKELDLQMADLSDQILSGTNLDDMTLFPENHELSELQDLALQLYGLKPPNSPGFTSQERIWEKVEETWHTEKPYRQGWRKLLPNWQKTNLGNAEKISLRAITIAIVLLIAMLPLLSAGDSLSGAAQGDLPFWPFLISAIFLVVIGWWLSNRK